MAEIRNTIELNIYEDETLEIRKTFKTYGLKWKAFKAVLAKQKEYEALKADDAEAALALIRGIINLIFPTITEDDLDDAYTDDVFNCFDQAVTISNKMAKNL